VLASVVAIVYAAGVTCLLLLVIKRMLGLRATEAEEREGLDTAVHGEQGYAG